MTPAKLRTISNASPKPFLRQGNTYNMTNTEKMNRLKSIAKMIIDCTEKSDPQMPWMVQGTEDEFAQRANSQIADLLKIANTL